MDGERVRLADGGDLIVRSLRREDAALLRNGFRRLSESSRHLRFLAAKPALSEREVEYLTDVDHVDHEAIGAREAATGCPVGVARYIRDPDEPDAAEAAITVVDAWQGRGVGRLLLDRLVQRAQASGITRFRASLSLANAAVRHMFERIGTVRVLRQGAGTMDVEVVLPVADDAPRLALRGAARREATLSAPDEE